jgi:hypothetical protein
MPELWTDRISRAVIVDEIKKGTSREAFGKKHDISSTITDALLWAYFGTTRWKEAKQIVGVVQITK